LDVFAATHNFFALHLVTASHAFRILYDHAGPHADATFNLGLAAGYAAVGAPEFESRQTPACQAEIPDQIAQESLLSLCADDEHDYKLAYSATRQAEFFNDARYLDVARTYLLRHIR
jgi:hypothetical protein